MQRGKIQALGLGVGVEIGNDSSSIYFGSGPIGGGDHMQSCPVHSVLSLERRIRLLPLWAHAFLWHWRLRAELHNGHAVVVKSGCDVG